MRVYELAKELGLSAKEVMDVRGFLKSPSRAQQQPVHGFRRARPRPRCRDSSPGQEAGEAAPVVATSPAEPQVPPGGQTPTGERFLRTQDLASAGGGRSAPNPLLLRYPEPPVAAQGTDRSDPAARPFERPAAQMPRPRQPRRRLQWSRPASGAPDIMAPGTDTGRCSVGPAAVRRRPVWAECHHDLPRPGAQTAVGSVRSSCAPPRPRWRPRTPRRRLRPPVPPPALRPTTSSLSVFRSVSGSSPAAGVATPRRKPTVQPRTGVPSPAKGGARACAADRTRSPDRRAKVPK